VCPGWENVQVGYHDSAALQGKEAPRAPGMKYKHYSPKARVVLFESGSDLSSITNRVKQDLTSIYRVDGHNHIENGHSKHNIIGIVRTRTWPVALSLAERSQSETHSQKADGNTDVDALTVSEMIISLADGVHTIIYDVDLGSSAEAIARGLFAALRSLDEMNVDAIYIEGIRDDEGDLAAAVMNRLRKAAEVVVAV